MNNIDYDQRLAFVHGLLEREYNLSVRGHAVSQLARANNPPQVQEVTPIEYDPQCPFPYNNFVYRIDLGSPLTQDVIAVNGQQPGSRSISAGTIALVVRLANAAAGLNDTNRVENEVACMSLAREALNFLPHSIVPHVYGWGSAHDGGQGWIAQEFMPGVTLDRDFQSMGAPDKGKILEQIANIFAALQRFQIPESMTGYGGLTFDSNRAIVAAAMTKFSGGPFDTYAAFFQATLHQQLAAARKSPSRRLEGKWTRRTA